jgi:hypothetical protein
MFVKGTVIHLLLLLVIFAIFYYVQRLAEGGKRFEMKVLPPVEAMSEAVGRAVEVGRPVHYTPGFYLGGLYTPGASRVLAGLAILEYVANLCAKMGARMVVTLSQPEAIPLAEENIKTGYLMAGEEPPEDVIRWISSEQYAFAVGVLTTIQEEMPAANFLIGSFWSEALQFAEAGHNVGAIGIAGATGQLPMFVAAMDYVLIGEELFAAQAYVSGDEIQIASIGGQDWVRLLLMGLVFLVWLAANLGLPVMDIINM